MIDFEKRGVFYLGREVAPGADLVLYDSRDLTTHAVIVGMTGSGKTGLGVALLEEAELDGIPSLIIDPKGDLGNLLLAFPQLRPVDFLPWVDPAEATRRGVSTEALAAQTAERWRAGLAEWGPCPERIARFAAAARAAIYTPGSRAGLPLQVLRSFTAPSDAVRRDDELLRERVESAASAVLALLGIDADLVSSREHILIANLLDSAWRQGRDLDLAALVQQIQSPPMDKLGVLDIETFFPAKERTALALRVNGLLAAPGFAAWLEGQPLDIAELLYGPDGKPRCAILSLAHHSDPERMFIVTLVLDHVVSWMRAQGGTGSLRAVLYMDEIFGSFPPSANPPSKRPMLQLLKQARAHGLGVVLATQNPVDLDYKGLANCGTWFIGRLQTERDKERVLAGLEGASNASGQAFDRPALERILGSLAQRVFLMNNVHQDAPVVFQSRFALSYLRGPLLREDIQRLMAKQRPAPAPREAPAAVASEVPAVVAHQAVPAGVREVFVAPVAPAAGSTLRPALLAAVDLHFVSAPVKLDHWRHVFVAAPSLAGADGLLGDELELFTQPLPTTSEPPAGARFTELAAAALRARSYERASRDLAAALYQTSVERVMKHAATQLVSVAGESERDFRVRIQHALAEQRDAGVENLRNRYGTRLAALDQRIRTAEQRLATQEGQYQDQRVRTAASVGSSVLQVLLGRKRVSATNVRRAGSVLGGIGRSRKEKLEVDNAAENVELLRAEKSKLEEQCAAEIEALRAGISLPDQLEVTEVRPRKSDLMVRSLVLAWLPWALAEGAAPQALYPRGELVAVRAV